VVLAPQNFAEITTTQINGFTRHSGCALHHQPLIVTHQHQRLSATQVTPRHDAARGLSTTDVGKFDVTHIGALYSTRSVRSIHQLLALTSTQIGALTPRSAGLSYRVARLSTTDVGDRDTQIASSRAQIGALDAPTSPSLMRPDRSAQPTQLAVSPPRSLPPSVPRTFDLHSTQTVSSQPRSSALTTTSISALDTTQSAPQRTQIVRSTPPISPPYRHAGRRLERDPDRRPHRQSVACLAHGLAEITTTQINGLTSTQLAGITTTNLASLNTTASTPQRHPGHGLTTTSSRLTTTSRKFDVTHIARSIPPDRCAEPTSFSSLTRRRSARSTPHSTGHLGHRAAGLSTTDVASSRYPDRRSSPPRSRAGCHQLLKA